MNATPAHLDLAVWIVRSAAAYVGLGALFAVPFAFAFAGRIDPVAARGSLGFRLLLLPGAVLLWPYLLTRLLRGAPPPDEHTPHTRVARTEPRG